MLQVISFLLKCDLKVVFRLVYLILNYSFSSGCVVFGGYLLDEGASKDKMYCLCRRCIILRRLSGTPETSWCFLCDLMGLDPRLLRDLFSTPVLRQGSSSRSCSSRGVHKATNVYTRPDHNNQVPQQTNLRHNKQCFDMVLNIPFPSTLAHKNTAVYCVRLSGASCDGALLDSYLSYTKQWGQIDSEFTTVQVAEVTPVRAKPDERLRSVTLPVEEKKWSRLNQPLWLI